MVPIIDRHVDKFEFQNGIDNIFSFFRSVNKYADERAPWKLAKDEKYKDELSTSIAFMTEAIRLGNNLLAPILPETHNRICERFSYQPPQKWEGNLDWKFLLDGKRLMEKTILFPRL